MPRNTGTNEPRQTRAQIAAEAQEHVRNAERHRALGSRCEGEALQHYAEAGKELNAAKELGKHGKFERWLRENFHASKDTAEDYMTIARCWPRFADAGSLRKCVKLTRDFERHGQDNSVAVNRRLGRWIAEDFARCTRGVEISGHFARSTREAILHNFGGGHGWCRSDAARDAAVFLHTDPVGRRLWAEVQSATKTYINEVLVPQLITFHENLLVERVFPAFGEWLDRELAEHQPHPPQPDQPVPVEPPQPADELPETEQPVPGQPQPRPPVQRRRITRGPDASETKGNAG